MKYSGNNLSVQAGLIASLGNAIRWQITGNGDYYLIQPAGDLTKYLAVQADGNAVLQLISATGTSVPTNALWDVSIADGGGSLVKNVYNSAYLVASEMGVAATFSIGTSESNYYQSCVWRIANTLSYGDNNSYQYVELPADFSFGTCYMFSGGSKAPSSKSEYNNVLWRTADNFTFSGYDSNYITVNPSNGLFTASVSSERHTATITATHKVTGRVSTFTLVINPESVLVGVTNIGHDHAGALSAISPILEGCGYSEVNLHTGAFTESQIDSYLDNDINNVFVSRSHASLVVDELDEQIGTFLLITSNRGLYLLCLFPACARECLCA